MAHATNIVDDNSSSSFPSSLVIWVDKGNAFKTHLSSTVVSLREILMLETFIDTDSALEAMSAAVRSCQTGKEKAKRQRIACVITNMQRDHPRSGLELLQRMKNIFHTNVLSNEFSSFPPTIMYSAGTIKNSSLSDECKAAGAMLVLANNVNEVQRIIIESVYPSISLNILLNPSLEQRAKLSNIPSEYHVLFTSHYLNPLPDIYGGKLTAVHAQQFVLLKWRLLYNVLLNDVLQTFRSHCTSEKHYISGGLAINHWLNLHRFPSFLTCDFDFRFENQANVKQYANHMKSVLEKHTQIIRVNMSRLGLQCDDPKVSTDDYGCRVYFPLHYYNSSTTASTSSCYDFKWKVFDVSHNWHGDPIDMIKERELCYLGEKEILKELHIDYGVHKEQRRQLRLEFVNFVLKSK